MPKKFFTIAIFTLASLLAFPAASTALSTYITDQGGTGTTTPSGILYGDNGATKHLNTVTIGSNLTFSGGTLSATGGSGGTFSFTPFPSYNATGTAIGFTNGLFSTASSTFNNSLFITNLSQGSLYTGTNGLVQTTATGTISGSTGLSVTAGQSVIGSGLTITNTGVTSNLAGSGIAVSGATGAVTISANFGFTQGTNFNANENATTTPIWFKASPYSLFASTTAWIDQLNVGSTTSGTLATSTFFGNTSVRGNASSTNEFVSSLGSGATTNVCALTSGLLSISGCNNGTVTSIATNNGVTGGTITGSGTIGLATISAGVLGAVTNGVIPTSQATSTLFGTGQAGQVLAWSAGVPTWLATTTNSCGTGIACTFSNGTWSFTNTGPTYTFPWTSATNYNVNTNSTTTPIWTKLGLFASSTSQFDQINVGSTTSSLMATSTFFGNTSVRGNASSTNEFVSSLGSGGTTNVCALSSGLLTITGCNNGTVTSVSGNNGLTGSVTTSGTIGLATINAGVLGAVTNGSVPTSQATSTLFGTGVGGTVLTWAGGNPAWVATSTDSCTTITCSFSGTTESFSIGSNAIALSQLAQISGNRLWGNISGATANVSEVATTSLYTLGNGLVQSSALFQQKENRSFTYATTTGWTGTTTIPLEVGYGEVWNNAQCYTDVGTLNVQFGYGTASTSLFNASTTIGVVGMTPNNTMTAGNKVKVVIGTPASLPTVITCTVNDTN